MVPGVDDDQLLALCHRAVDAVPVALAPVENWRPAGERPGQYAIDLIADEAVLAVLEEAGIGVVSEESGVHRPGSPLVAVIDPVDGSTNASRGIPWYASSICVLDAAGPRVSVVANLATGVRYHAVRGGGAWRGTTRVAPSGCEFLRDAVVAISGMPKGHLGWAQFRAFGAAALELCAVADGTIDAFVVGTHAALAPWDYLGAMLVCHEAGAVMSELKGGELVTLDPSARLAVVAAATTALLVQLEDAAAPGARSGPSAGGGRRGRDTTPPSS